MTWLAAARTAASAAIRGCKTQLNNVTHQQTRNMGGGGPSLPWYRSLDGRPPPPEFQGPDFVTYAGLTLPKRKVDYDWYISKVAGAAVWFTMLYHFSINWEEHWYGDIWVFEKDVQTNGWDDENGHGHGHGHNHH